MAVFGNLQDFPFSELFSLLGRKTGVLEVVVPSHRAIYISLSDGRIQKVREGKRILTPDEARALLRELVKGQQDGAFEFQVAEVQPWLNWSLDEVMASEISEEKEREKYREVLPDAKTRFVVRGDAEIKSVVLEEKLQTFWKRAKYYLQRPISVEKLAEVLSQPLEHTAYYLHRMRLLGFVEVYRVIDMAMVSEEKANVWNRIWMGVRKMMGTAA